MTSRFLSIVSTRLSILSHFPRVSIFRYESLILATIPFHFAIHMKVSLSKQSLTAFFHGQRYFSSGIQDL